MRNAPGWMEKNYSSAPLRRGKVPQKIYWEGNILNKISKKIVSLITMAAFVLTLVPAAAFAADAGSHTVTLDGATYATVKIVEGNTATVDIAVGDTALSATTGAIDQVALMVYKDGKNVSTADYFTDEGNNSFDNRDAYGPAYWVREGAENTTVKVPVTFAEAGVYTVKALNYTSASGSFDASKATEVGTVRVYADQVPDEDYSGYGVVSNGVVAETYAAEVGDTVDTTFVVNYAENKGTNSPIENVWVWAEDKDGEVADVVTFDGVKGSKEVGTITNGKPEVKVTFNKGGEYTLRAGIGEGVDQIKEDASYLADYTVVNVATEPVVIDKIDSVKATLTINGQDQDAEPINIDANGIGKLNLTGTGFAFDGVDTVTITGIAKDENGDPIQGKTITATTNKDTVVEFNKAEKNVATAVTDNFGKFSISFVMPNKENATVTLVNEEADLSYTIQIWAVKSTAQNIDRTLTGGYVLAGNDSKYGAEVYGDATTTPVSFADAVQFKITDQQGEAMTGQAAADGAKIDVRAVAKNSTLKNGDLKLIWDQDAGVYTLGYVDDGYAKDLVPGKYEVRVALPSQDAATVTFNVAKFGKVQDTVLAVTARDYDQSPANPNEEVMTVDDTITLGQMITVKAKYVDENGLKVPAKYVSFNFNGKAVSDWNKWNNVFATEPDIAANDSLIGTTVKVVAFNTANKQLVEKTLTVADSYTDKSLEFSSDNGAISKDNKVNVTVVDANGKTQQVEGYMTAWVADQSNEDAKISVDVNKNGVHDVQNGKGSLTVYADQETTADIVVVVKAGTEAYYGTLEYTFGSENALANRTVVMTIDSTEYVVNNNIITGDAAPYIDSNWRTMVPIRALAESFDAEVIWNQDDSTVTINFDGDTTIVMAVGETAYTVDGAEATMDTEPVNAGDRVYVPVRFAAEGLGFSVLPLYNEAGLTASVVFQK